MKIDIPDKLIKKFLVERILPSSGLAILMADDVKRKISDLIIKEILENYKDKIKWPKITKAEIKDKMLDILAEKALDKEE